MNKTLEVEVDMFDRSFFFVADVDISYDEGIAGSLSVPSCVEFNGINSFDVQMDMDNVCVIKQNCTKESNPLNYKLLEKAIYSNWPALSADLIANL